MRPLHYLLPALFALILVAGLTLSSRLTHSELPTLLPRAAVLPLPNGGSLPLVVPTLVRVPLLEPELPTLVRKENIQDETECRPGAAE